MRDDNLAVRSTATRAGERAVPASADQLIAAIEAESRACYGHPGGGARARDVGYTIYEASHDPTAPFDPHATLRAVAKRLSQLARAGRIGRGRDRYGAFYRARPHQEV